MKHSPALFSYRNADSIIHRWPAWIKLILLVAVTLRTFSNSIYGLSLESNLGESLQFILWVRTGFYFLLATVMFVLAKTPFSSLLRLKFIFWLAILMVTLSLLSFRVKISEKTGMPTLAMNVANIFSDLLYAARFFVTAVVSLVVFETTSRLEILNSLDSMEQRLCRFIPPLKKLHMALVLSITITFIPEVFACWNKVSMAAAARTPVGKKGKRRFSVSALYSQFTAFFLNMLQYAEEVRRAICNRM